jgi:hypothetical protein
MVSLGFGCRTSALLSFRLGRILYAYGFMLPGWLHWIHAGAEFNAALVVVYRSILCVMLTRTTSSIPAALNKSRLFSHFMTLPHSSTSTRLSSISLMRGLPILSCYLLLFLAFASSPRKRPKIWSYFLWPRANRQGNGRYLLALASRSATYFFSIAASWGSDTTLRY